MLTTYSRHGMQCPKCSSTNVFRYGVTETRWYRGIFVCVGSEYADRMPMGYAMHTHVIRWYVSTLTHACRNTLWHIAITGGYVLQGSTPTGGDMYCSRRNPKGDNGIRESRCGTRDYTMVQRGDMGMWVRNTKGDNGIGEWCSSTVQLRL
jgi:hypothetical protein